MVGINAVETLCLLATQVQVCGSWFSNVPQHFFGTVRGVGGCCCAILQAAHTIILTAA
jgi:hypothetical protein